MSNAYKIHKQEATYFLTLQVVYWIDIFSRKRYREIVAESLMFCVKEKGLNIFAYVMNYIHQNPVRAGIVEKAEDYLYSSARDYAGMEGLIKAEVLNLHLMVS